jgi:hypothetical protein
VRCVIPRYFIESHYPSDSALLPMHAPMLTRVHTLLVPLLLPLAALARRKPSLLVHAVSQCFACHGLRVPALGGFASIASSAPLSPLTGRSKAERQIQQCLPAENAQLAARAAVPPPLMADTMLQALNLPSSETDTVDGSPSEEVLWEIGGGNWCRAQLHLQRWREQPLNACGEPVATDGRARGCWRRKAVPGAAGPQCARNSGPLQYPPRNIVGIVVRKRRQECRAHIEGCAARAVDKVHRDTGGSCVTLTSSASASTVQADDGGDEEGNNVPRRRTGPGGRGAGKARERKHARQREHGHGRAAAAGDRRPR